MGDRDPIAVLTETPVRMRAKIERIGPGAFSRTYAYKKWNVAQILTHLVQCEIGFSQRIRQALTVNDYVAQPFDQDDWMNSETVIDGPAALAAFCSLRNFDLLLFGRLRAAQRTTMLANPVMGPQTVQLLLEIMAGRDLNHVGHLEAIA